MYTRRAFMTAGPALGATIALVAAAGLSIATSLAQDNLNPTPGAQGLEGKTQLLGTVSPWLKKAQRLGPADENKRVAITAYLSWRNQTELEQLVADQTTPGSARYGQFLSPEQFHAAFSPKASDVTRVQEALQHLGFKIGYTPASGLFVAASGTVAQIEATFQVSQNVYAYRGKLLRAHAEDPSIPASLAGVVTYIGGLDDSRLLKRPARPHELTFGTSSMVPLALMPHGTVGRLPGTATANTTSSPELMPPYGGPGLFPCSHYWGDTRANLETASPFPYGSNLPWVACGYTPQQIRQAYGSDRVWEAGRGVRIAITDVYSSPTIVADVNQYSANHGLPPLTGENFQQVLQPGASSVPADDPCGYQTWWQEQTLDVTAVHTMAPSAFIVYVGGACDAVDSVDGGVAIEPVYQVIDTRLADIVTNSWLYNGEADVTPGELRSDNAEFIQAAVQGMSLLFAAGDDGDLTMSGFAFGGPNAVASGSWPATSPFVTAMGGTSLLLKNASGEKSEYGWAQYETVFNDPLISPNGQGVTDQGQGWIVPFFWGDGGGGGPSLVMPEPFYQVNVVPTLLATQTYLADGTPVPLSPPRRVTPDISMVADPVTGFLIGETYTISTPPVDPGCTQLSETTEYCELPIGGTSLATPLFAGVLALVNEHRSFHASGPVGFVNPALYRLPVGEQGSNHAPIIDVNAPSEPTGALGAYFGINNFVAFVTIQSYENSNGNIIENVDTSLRSAPGYDNVTGLGAPNIPALIRALER
jgi:subtilase family serine protease